jgi:hypothetical protein
MKKTPKRSEYEAFTNILDTLLSVPHSEIKNKLDEEKRDKKRKKARKSSVSHEASERG